MTISTQMLMNAAVVCHAVRMEPLVSIPWVVMSVSVQQDIQDLYALQVCVYVYSLVPEGLCFVDLNKCS